MEDYTISIMPSLLTPENLASLIAEFSHAVFNGYDPHTQVGCQRESFQDPGFGWLYFGLCRILSAKKALVIGSGRGYSVACMALAMRETPEAEVLLIDPGYTQWQVDNSVSDGAVGLWQHGEALSHFKQHLNLDNVRLMPLRSDEAFATLKEQGAIFDLILIDGEHSFKQGFSDLQNAKAVLSPGGIILAHDANCRDWPGVALALQSLCRTDLDMTSITIAPYPGLALIQKRVELFKIRPSTEEENKLLNQWRVAEKVTPRPLSPELTNGSTIDPQIGVTSADGISSLYSVIDDEKLIGGFGLRYRTFRQAGADDFTTDDGRGHCGYLYYGAVLHPDYRGRGRNQLILSQILRMTRGQALYLITRADIANSNPGLAYTRVGHNNDYIAYRIELADQQEQSVQGELNQRTAQVAELTVAIADATRTKEELDRLKILLRDIEQSVTIQIRNKVVNLPVVGKLLKRAVKGIYRW